MPGAFVLQWVYGPGPADSGAEFETRSRFDALAATINALLREMRRQGLLGADAIPPGKLHRAIGEIVTPDEIRRALLRSIGPPFHPRASRPACSKNAGAGGLTSSPAPPTTAASWSSAPR